MSIGIVVALPEELTTLTAKKLVKGECLALTDTLTVAYSGAGCKNAQTAAEALVALGATRLISWGCAGALSDRLQPGALVLADQLIAADGGQPPVDSAWLTVVSSHLAASPKLHIGSIAESHTLVASQQEKQQLHTQSHALAVDMESVAIARVASQHQLPFLAIRAIADPANMDLSPAISYALNPQGDVVLAKLLAYLLRHPFEVFGLIKLAVHFNAALKTLKPIAQQLDRVLGQ